MAFEEQGSEPTFRARHIEVSDVEAWLADELTPLAALLRVQAAVSGAIEGHKRALGIEPKAPRVRRAKGSE